MPHRSVPYGVIVAVCLVCGCKESVSGDNLSGAGGESGAAGDDCDADYPECCSSSDRVPCLGLSETACGGKAYCHPVHGVRFKRADSAADGPIDGPESYLGCFSFCSGASPAFSCTLDPSEPTACYQVPSAAPDGWVEFRCSELPESCE